MHAERQVHRSQEGDWVDTRCDIRVPPEPQTGVGGGGFCPLGPTIFVRCKAILHNTVSLVHSLSSETTDFLIF